MHNINISVVPISFIHIIEKCVAFFSFSERFAEMKECKGNYFVTVIEDDNTNQIVGCASLVLEHKFIHNTGKVCILL